MYDRMIWVPMGVWFLFLKGPFQAWLKGHQKEHQDPFSGSPYFDTYPYSGRLKWNCCSFVVIE